MDRTNQSRGTLIRTAIAGLLVLGLMYTTRSADALSWLTRPAVAVVVGIFGGYLPAGGSDIIIGHLRVPWSRDCAGFDVLVVLWGLILWSGRHDPVSRRFWIRMILAVPASMLANVARVLTIIGWRQAFYPAVESPQMHYFIGFLWLLPLLAVFVPRSGRSFVSYAVETSLLAATLSLVAPQAAAPGGAWVTGCTLLLLAGQQWRRLEGRNDMLLVAAWVAAAVLITGAAMESLWLPWLLLCPWCFPRRWVLTPAVLLLPGTIPVFAMKLPWLTLPGFAMAAWLLLREEPLAHRSTDKSILGWPVGLGVLLMFSLPFLASTLGPALMNRTRPPVGVMAQPLDPGSFLLRFMGQPGDLTLTWNAPSGSGRHHTLSVCLLYRGRKIHDVPTSPGIQTDGEWWLSEAFLMPNGELHDYDQYLRATLLPFTAAGVHLIAAAPANSMTAPQFEQLARIHYGKIATLENHRTAD